MKKRFDAGEFMLTAIPIFIIICGIVTIIGIVYLGLHPELIGEYIGRIMNGFK